MILKINLREELIKGKKCCRGSKRLLISQSIYALSMLYGLYRYGGRVSTRT